MGEDAILEEFLDACELHGCGFNLPSHQGISCTYLPCPAALTLDLCHVAYLHHACKVYIQEGRFLLSHYHGLLLRKQSIACKPTYARSLSVVRSFFSMLLITFTIGTIINLIPTSSCPSLASGHRVMPRVVRQTEHVRRSWAITHMIVLDEGR